MAIDNFEVVKKLIGDVNPVGSAHIDVQRLESLKELCKLADHLLWQINVVARDNKDRHEHSMKEAGQYAQKFLDDYVHFTIK